MTWLAVAVFLFLTLMAGITIRHHIKSGIHDHTVLNAMTVVFWLVLAAAPLLVAVGMPSPLVVLIVVLGAFTAFLRAIFIPIPHAED